MARHKIASGANGARVKKPRKTGVRCFTREDLAQQLRITQADRVQIAKNLNVSLATISRAMTGWPELQEVERQAQGELVDFAYGSLKRAVLDGESWAVREAYKRYGYLRGANDRIELHGPNGGPIRNLNVQVNITPQIVRQLSDDTIERALDGDTRALAEATEITGTRH